MTRLTVRTYTLELEEPESDGTLDWSATTVVAVHAASDGRAGLGWTYAPAATAGLVTEVLAPAINGTDPMDVGRAHTAMRRAVRNASIAGLASYAVSAADIALWDLKARLLDVPLTALLGRVRDRVPVYGSGGFVSLTDDALREQLTGWVKAGARAVKIKIGEDRGANLTRDVHRIAVARETIGPDVALMVDANGAYEVKQAVRIAAAAPDLAWFEEPVSSDRLDDLALLRGLVAAEVTAGEYGTTLEYFRRMCPVVDCLQVDASRCGGYTGVLAAAALADAYGLQVSTHCAPHLHAPIAAALPNLRHSEWFADHVTADHRLFDGLPELVDGALIPSTDRPGHGMTLRD